MPIHLPPLSRRDFVIRSATVGAGWLLGSRLRAATREIDPHAWALISDPHVAADRAKVARGINMATQLSSVVTDVLDQPHHPAGGLVNGDLAFNTGTIADYATFSELVAPLRATGIPLHLGLGNHDQRENFWSSLDRDPVAKRPVENRQAAMISGSRANWFMLDSLDKTNTTPGLLGESQLGWLARALDGNREKPALVMIHHNFVAAPGELALLDQDALLSVIRPRRHVKAYLFGHSHRWSVEKDSSGLHLINLPATSYVFSPGQLTGWVMARLERDSLRLQLRCLDRTRPEHDRRFDLRYRS